MIQCKINIHFPTDETGNKSHTFSKEAVLDAFEQMEPGVPIVFTDDEGERYIIGVTTSKAHDIYEQPYTGIMECIVDGELRSDGVNVMLHEDGKKIRRIESIEVYA